MPKAWVVPLVLLSCVACSGSGSHAGPATAKACADIATATTHLDESTDQLAPNKRLFAELTADAKAIVRDAPASLKADALALQHAIATAYPYVQSAANSAQLERRKEDDAAFGEALSDISAYGGTVEDWHTQHC